MKRQPFVGTSTCSRHSRSIDPGSHARRVPKELNIDAAADIKRELACYIDAHPRRTRRHPGKFRNAGAGFLCGRTTTEAGQLIAGPDVGICAACINLATEALVGRAG